MQIWVYTHSCEGSRRVLARQTSQGIPSLPAAPLPIVAGPSVLGSKACGLRPCGKRNRLVQLHSSWQ